MRKSSRLFHRIEALAGFEHCPEDGYAPAGERDDCLGVVLSFAPLAIIEGLGERVPGGDGAEGALEENALECLVAAVCTSPVPGLAGLADNGSQSGGAGESVGRMEALDGSDV